jgi:hypothetical protein
MRNRRCSGPAVIVIPPGVVHAFRFAPHAQGCVLTLSAGAVVQGDAQAAGQALRTLFAAPRVLALGGRPALADAVRIAACLNCWQTNLARRGPAGSARCRCGWRVPWSGGWANWRARRTPPPARRSASIRHFSRASWCWWKPITPSTGRWRGTPAVWG